MFKTPEYERDTLYATFTSDFFGQVSPSLLDVSAGNCERDLVDKPGVIIRMGRI
jgi:hypothetical protein